MRARLVALVLSAILIFYFLIVGDRALIMLADGRPAMVLLGVGVLLLPVIGIWSLWRELRIGFGSQELAKRLTAEGAMPEHSLSFDECKADVEGHPEDWRSWYRLAVAYGDAGDTRNGRRALNKALDLSKGN